MLNYLIIGSSAAKHHLKDGWREPKDFDIFKTESCGDLTFLTDKRIEFSIIPDYPMNLLSEGSQNNYISLNNLYTLKLSHCFWPLNLDKTINDIIALSRLGCTINEQLFYVMKQHWSKIHGDKSFLSLNKNKDAFFDDAVKKVVEHDTLHEWVAKYDEPLYKKCLKDYNEVLLDYGKFSALPHEDKIHMIREEIMVIGIERFAIHKGLDMPSGLCYNRASKIVLTRLMKNKFADFMAFNLDEILSYKMTKEYNVVKEKFYA